MATNKDSDKVVRFLGLFAELKDCCDNEPEQLLDLARQDEGVRKLGVKLCWASRLLRDSERWGQKLFAAPVDPKFTAAWRDFESRFDDVVAQIEIEDEFPGLGSVDLNPPSFDERWQGADDTALAQARGFERVIELAEENFVDGDRDFPDEFRWSLEDGIRAWKELRIGGLNLRGILRRRALVPFVHVPRHVAGKEGNTELFSMLSSLKQAHDAFIFGAHLAALGLMRSITEVMLRDHYGAGGEGLKLSERINRARGLPNAANGAALHRLRKLANTVLHLDPKEDERLKKIDPLQLEKEIISLLLVVRALIESAPSWRLR